MEQVRQTQDGAWILMLCEYTRAYCALLLKRAGNVYNKMTRKKKTSDLFFINALKNAIKLFFIHFEDVLISPHSFY